MKQALKNKPKQNKENLAFSFSFLHKNNKENHIKILSSSWFLQDGTPCQCFCEENVNSENFHEQNFLMLNQNGTE